jgi:hypothetical protein
MTTNFSKARFHVLRAAFLAFLCSTNLSLWAQNTPSFRVSAADTVARAQPFQVRYIIENADVANFQLPNLEHFEQKGSPSVSQNMSIINGQRKQSITYTYWLVAPENGNFELPKLEIPTTQRDYLSCQAKKIVVTEEGAKNPKLQPADQLSQNNIFNNPFGGGGGNPFGDNPFGGNPFGGNPFGDFPQIDVNQFFNNPQFFNFEMPRLEMPQMPNFNDLFKDLDQLLEQQFKNAPKKPDQPKIDPKTGQPIYKI